MARVVQVRIIAVHVTCDLCGAHARIPRTSRVDVHDPLIGFTNGHRAPKITQVEVTMAGHHSTVQVD